MGCRRKVFAAVSLALLGLELPEAFAQSGLIRGVVVDSADAAIPAAKQATSTRDPREVQLSLKPYW